jgi:hypothetical protein
MTKIIKLKKNKGFVILFAVTISAIILSITLGITDIAFQEIKFSTSVKDTNNAFFAADTGAECALVNDKTSGSVFVEGTSPSITCNDNSMIATESPALYWSFIIPNLGNEGEGCAKVTVNKSVVPNTTIISKGYNIGSPDCNSNSSNLVERELELNY